MSAELPALAETVYAGPPLKATVRLRPEVVGSYPDGLTAIVAGTRHFHATTSVKAQRAAAKVDVWAKAEPDVPAQDRVRVRLISGLSVFLPTAEVVEIGGPP